MQFLLLSYGQLTRAYMFSPPQLIDKLIDDPTGFRESKLSSELLRTIGETKAYNLLIPPLLSDDSLTVSTALAIASELGGAAEPLLPVINPYLNHPDAARRGLTIDIFAACLPARGHVDGGFLLHGLNDRDIRIRLKCMRILCRVSDEIWRSIERGSAEIGNCTPEGSTPNGLIDFLRDEESTARKMIVINMCRNRILTPTNALLESFARMDTDIRAFVLDLLIFETGRDAVLRRVRKTPFLKR